MKAQLGGYSAGINDVGRGLKIIGERPRLWGWVIAPAIAALVILVALGWLAYGAVDPLVEAVASVFPGFLERWVAGFLRVLVLAVLVVGGYFVFFGVAALIAAPFNEFLSEAVEVELTGTDAPPFSLATFVRDLLLGIAHAARRVAVYVISIAGLFLLGLLVPALGTVVSVILGIIVTVRFAAYDAMDAVWARRGWSYQQKMDFLRLHSDRCFGIGAGVSLLMLIPGLNLIALSAGAVGATLLTIDVEGRGVEGTSGQ